MERPDRLFKAFGDETRLRILNLLAQRECCVCEFQGILKVPQPKISRHLAYLRRSGLVVTRKRGKWVLYRLAEPTGSVHAMLIRCMKMCFRDVQWFQQDATRLPACCKAAS